jgi:hypothetical protein
VPFGRWKGPRGSYHGEGSLASRSCPFAKVEAVGAQRIATMGTQNIDHPVKIYLPFATPLNYWDQGSTDAWKSHLCPPVRSLRTYVPWVNRSSHVPFAAGSHFRTNYHGVYVSGASLFPRRSSYDWRYPGMSPNSLSCCAPRVLTTFTRWAYVSSYRAIINPDIPCCLLKRRTQKRTKTPTTFLSR